MIPTTLVLGATSGVREAAIAAQVNTPLSEDIAIILEGLPDGSLSLHALEPAQISRIAPGCLCCTGNLTMRVTLHRVIRRRPSHIYIGLATALHLDQIRTVLSEPPYDNLLVLTKDLHA